MKISATVNASVEPIENGWRLGIQKGDSLHYRDAQLDDYFRLPRHKFPHRSLTLSLQARASSSSIPGTWGFGLWNDPFGMSLGFGGNPFRLPALPNAVWFFSASEQNYLSFTDDKPAHGFLAQTFRAPNFHPLLFLSGMTFPFSRKLARKLLTKVIGEDAFQLWQNIQQQAVGLQSKGQSVDPTQWHSYRFEWSPKRVLFYVDGVQVFESPVSPNPPLGLIIWIDNQYAAFTPQGKIGFGVLENAEPAWIEIKDLNLS
jgi:hypothetical protein